jgi:deoxyribonuclease-4
MGAIFGPGGNSERFKRETDGKTVSAPSWLADIGLEAYEYEAGRGVKISAGTAAVLGEKAR